MHVCLLLFVDLQLAVVSDANGPSDTITSGDDVVMVETVLNGSVGAIKLELELLPAVGEVSILA